jgi:transcriptional regulator with XRE-family HTH domain
MREAAGLSQGEFAARARLSRTTVNRIERGARSVNGRRLAFRASLTTLEKVARALGVHVSALI